MAGPTDPFTPGVTSDETAGVDPDTFGKLKSQWSTFLDDPAAKTAAAQFLVGALTPTWGGIGAGLGQAIGSAGEAVTRRGMLESREELDRVKAEAAMMNAETKSRLAEQRNLTAQTGLERDIYRAEAGAAKSAA